MREALHYERLEGDRVRCLLCPHHCRIAPGRHGICRVRENRAGRLYAATYGLVGALSLDPVEKKPLYHFHPGKHILSTGTRGCSFRCRFCQNWELAHGDPQLAPLSPAELVRMARRETQRGNVGLAYTYSEPLVWYEFVLDTARLAAEAGLQNVLVTNGFLETEPLRELLPVVHALNIDVKGMEERFYRDMLRGRLGPVLATAEAALGAGRHVEITALIIPGLNDSREAVEKLVDWLVQHLGRDVPLHLSRYFPHYRLDLPPTPADTLRRAWEQARQALPYVYLGNLPGSQGQDTFCPSCGQVVVERRGYQVNASGLDGTRCTKCGARLAFVR